MPGVVAVIQTFGDRILQNSPTISYHILGFFLTTDLCLPLIFGVKMRNQEAKNEKTHDLADRPEFCACVELCRFWRFGLELWQRQTLYLAGNGKLNSYYHGKQKSHAIDRSSARVLFSPPKRIR